MGTGDILSILAGVMFAVHLVIIAKYLESEDVYVLTIMQLIFVTIFSAAFAFPFETLPPNPFELNIVLCMLYNGFLSTFAALLLQFWGQKYISPSRTSLIVSTESVFGSLFGVLFLTETMTMRMVTGCALIFFAIILSESKLKQLIDRKAE
jgi:drug/metabolite transporter (DMT)-like permease